MLNKNLKEISSLLTLFLIALLSVTSIEAQQVSATASLDSMVMPIGQQQKLRFEASQPKNVNLQFPIFSDTIIKNIEIIASVPADTVDHGDRISVIKDYIITSFDSGFYYFEPFEILVNPLQDGGTVTTDPFILKVITFEVDTTQGVFDIKEPLELKYEFNEILPWVLGGLLLVLIIVGIIYLVRQLMRKEPILPGAKPKPVEPPHIIALRELQELKEEKLWQTDRVKPFYTQLTDVLRIYMEGRFGIRAMEETSVDIIKDMKGKLADKDSAMRNLVQILQTADLVKFAKMKPLPNENDLCMMNAILFVEQTRPVEQTTLEEEKKRMEDEQNNNDKEN